MSKGRGWERREGAAWGGACVSLWASTHTSARLTLGQTHAHTHTNTDRTKPQRLTCSKSPEAPETPHISQALPINKENCLETSKVQAFFFFF